ncbi:hypothetical protein G7046_g5910 [Stylonectria norvegica]|nr:hypothetical protein G7046_g5910 [Stylonectria norvegica]
MASALPLRDGLMTRLLALVLLLLVPSTFAGVDGSLKVTLLREPPPYQQLPELIPRDNSLCPSAGYEACGNEVPSDFCCPGASTCLILASNTTAVCCPKGACAAIQPIVCDLKLQDVSKYPKAPIHTVALDGSLPRCGSGCCPFGYVCNDDDQCSLDKHQDHYAFLVPQPSSTPATSSVMSMETSAVPVDPVPSLPTTSATPPSQAAEPTESSHESKRASDPAGLVTAVTVAGVCCFAGIGIFVWMKWFRKKKKAMSTRQSFTHHRDSGWGSWKCFATPGQTPLLPRHLVLQRGPDDKFIVTPSEAEFALPTPPAPPLRINTASPVELPATPVSPCMWMNLEHAAVEEPKLAYVIPAKRGAKRR